MKKNQLIPLGLATIVGFSSHIAAAPHQHSQGQFDLVIANQERLITMLQASGKISKTDNKEQLEAELKNYLQTRAKNEQERAKLAEAQNKNPELVDKRGLNHSLKGVTGRHNAFQRGKGKKKGFNFKAEDYSGDVRVDRVLAILIDFPDFHHNDNTAADSEMYYDDYTRQHYQDLLFSANGFTGPQGQNLISMRQFYEEQSGGSYSVEGNVAGWYTASQPAAFYGNNANGDARALIREALTHAAADPNVDLNWYDIEDRYDLDGDGNLREPDGLVDHIMVFHGSVGEEAGGGQLGEDAIWAHRWNLGGVFSIPGTQSEVPYWGNTIGAFDYTIQPVSSGGGVTSHEFGHDLGLPDEYDTQYSGSGEPVAYWSGMSSGSWAGAVPGTEPTGFSAWAKEQLQGRMGGNWLHGETIHIDDIQGDVYAFIDKASGKGRNNDAIRIDLPNKQEYITTPSSGEYAYYSGKGDSLYNTMSLTVDLSGTSSAVLNFNTWFDIESYWDFAYVTVNGQTIAGDITTDFNPTGLNRGNGITGRTNSWMNVSFDLSAFAGQQITLGFEYETDGYVTNNGIFIDDISINTDNGNIFFDDAESGSQLNLTGFSMSNGSVEGKPHYYLLEWRTHDGVDMGLKNISRWGELTSYNEGLLVWYVDNNYTNNWTGIHPGEGFLGVVDADQVPMLWNGMFAASTRDQIRDATFRASPQPEFVFSYPFGGFVQEDTNLAAISQFDDSKNYLGPYLPDSGRNVPNYGLKIEVVKESNDGSVSLVKISR